MTKKRILVLDTNVLLNEPQSLFRFPGATVIIPQTVLKELDRIKITKIDKTLQYNGRLVSRYLFTLSSSGNLSKGIELENGSIIKISSVNKKEMQDIPLDLKTKFNDDQILALAYKLKNDNKDSEVVIITNDLNMLIKAQALDIKIEYHSGVSSKSKIKRFFANQFATIKRNPVMAIFLTLTLGGIIAIIILLSTFLTSYIGTPTKGPPELVAQVQLFESKEHQYQNVILKDPSNSNALLGLAKLYIQMSHYYNDNQYYGKAIDVLSKAPEGKDRNFQIEAMIARLHFYLDMDDVANSEIKKIVATKSDSAFSALVEQAKEALTLKELDLNITFLVKALLIKPNDIETRLDLAKSYFENNQADNTIYELHKALEINDKHAIIYYNLGYVYWKKKADKTTSISYFEKYLELEPKGELAKQAKNNIKLIKKS